jgi:hypothetical protein
MSSIQQVLLFKRSADTIWTLGDYTSATILYFKTWFAIHDYILLERIGSMPKDHTERFRLLEKHFPDEYSLLDSEFNVYRSTYAKTVSKETCERIRKIVENGISRYKIA